MTPNQGDIWKHVATPLNGRLEPGALEAALAEEIRKVPLDKYDFLKMAMPPLMEHRGMRGEHREIEGQPVRYLSLFDMAQDRMVERIDFLARPKRH